MIQHTLCSSFDNNDSCILCGSCNGEGTSSKSPSHKAKVFSNEWEHNDRNGCKLLITLLCIIVFYGSVIMILLADRYGFKHLIFCKCVNADLHTCVICCFILSVWSSTIPLEIPHILARCNRNITNLNSCIYDMWEIMG